MRSFILIFIFFTFAVAISVQATKTTDLDDSSSNGVNNVNNKEIHPFRILFPDIFQCEANVTTIRSFLALLNNKVKSSNEKEKRINDQKSRIINYFIQSFENLTSELVEKFKKEMDIFSNNLFDLTLYPNDVCQYVYNTLYEYDQKKLGRTVVHTMEEFIEATLEREKHRVVTTNNANENSNENNYYNYDEL
ncbi:hypothetical protein ABK040_014266 [Willaertia magna]